MGTDVKKRTFHLRDEKVAVDLYFKTLTKNS